MIKKAIAIMSVLCFAGLTASGCGQSNNSAADETTIQPTTKAAVTTKLPKTDMTKWEYNADDDVYFQLGIS